MVDEPVLLGFGRAFEVVALEIFLDLLDRLTRVPGHDRIEARLLQSGKAKLAVTLTGRFAGKESKWKANVVRTEGLIDTKTRIMYVVAQLSGDELLSVSGKDMISIGQFVAAEIEGRVFDAVFQLPRAVLRQGNQVLVIDKDNKLQTRMVKVVEANREFVVISEGLNEGDIVCKSQLGVNVDGLLVQYDLGQGALS